MPILFGKNPFNLYFCSSNNILKLQFNNMATPHNTASIGEIAETVIMSGDPLRAKFMAEKFLENATLFNTTRNMFGYTGTYKGKKVSIMGHGMGMPSIGIYTHELYHFYGVKQIIRVGTAGCIQPGINIGDIVIAQAACTDSNYINNFLDIPGTFAPIGNFDLLTAAAKSSKDMNIPYHVGNILSSDIFYDSKENWKKWQKLGILAIEMECAALYTNAIEAKRKALTILTISDNIITKEETSSEERQKAFTNMMKVAFSII